MNSIVLRSVTWSLLTDSADMCAALHSPVLGSLGYRGEPEKDPPARSWGLTCRSVIEDRQRSEMKWVWILCPEVLEMRVTIY